jgi:HAD superfamily hydrolase (TIGR01509 family)
MIAAVLFDLFETLVSESETRPARASSLGEALGLDPVAFRTEWKAHRPLVVRGELSFGDALTAIGRLLGVGVPADRVRHACETRTREKAAAFQRIDPRLVTLTTELCRLGIRLGVVSNCFAEDVGSWPECALAPRFDCSVFSYTLGVAKPDSRIYLAAVEQLGVETASTLFVGDGPDSELRGAELAGLHALQACWFTNDPPDGRATGAFPRLFEPQNVLTFLSRHLR